MGVGKTGGIPPVPGGVKPGRDGLPPLAVPAAQHGSAPARSPWTCPTFPPASILENQNGIAA